MTLNLATRPPLLAKRILIDRDTAAAEVYVETWDDGSDGGADGFGPWKLSANPAGGAAGFFLVTLYLVQVT